MTVNKFGGIVVKIQFVMTDTFAGEANYSWGRRGEIEVDENASETAIIRRVKSALGMSGIQCRKENLGEEIRLYPHGMCRVIFIN